MELSDNLYMYRQHTQRGRDSSKPMDRYVENTSDEIKCGMVRLKNRAELYGAGSLCKGDQNHCSTNKNEEQELYFPKQRLR